HWPSMLRRPMVKRNSSLILFPSFSVPPHRIRAVTYATLLPAVMSILMKSKTTGSSDQDKKRSQVFVYESFPCDCSGGGTSNINISRRVIGKNSIEILGANRPCPVLNQLADRSFVRCPVVADAHSNSSYLMRVRP